MIGESVIWNPANLAASTDLPSNNYYKLIPILGAGTAVTLVVYCRAYVSVLRPMAERFSRTSFSLLQWHRGE